MTVARQKALQKHGAAKGAITMKGGHCYVGATPLLPGRMERKIIELKKCLDTNASIKIAEVR